MKAPLETEERRHSEKYVGWRVFLKIFFLKFLIKIQEAYTKVPTWYILEKFGRKLPTSNDEKLGNSENKQLTTDRKRFICDLFGNYTEFKLQEEMFKYFDYMLNRFFFSIYTSCLFCSKKIGNRIIFKSTKAPSLDTKFFTRDCERGRKLGHTGIFSGNVIKNLKFQKGKISKKENRLKGIKRKFKTNQGFIDCSLVLKILNNLLFKHLIKGFTREALRMIIYHLNTFIKDIILNLGQISINRQKKTKRYSHEWGTKNVVKKKSPLENFLEKTPNFKMDLKTVMRSFKKKKIPQNPVKKDSSIRQNPNPIKIQTSKKGSKVNTLEENISKTNKTLMALLDGIVKRRIRILKDATKNLSKYKPMPSKIVVEKEIKLEENVDKEDGIHRNSISLKKIKAGSFLTGNDCLNLMRNREEFVNKDIFFKFFFSLTLDYNLRFANINPIR